LALSSPAQVHAQLSEDQRRINGKEIDFYDIEECAPTTASKPTSTTNATDSKNAKENAKIIFQFLTSSPHNLTKPQAAGILANLYAESGLDPTNIEDPGGQSDEITVGGPGYGLAQWTSRNRQQGLKDLAESTGKKSGDLGVQIDYLWYELTHGWRQALSNLKKADDYRTAVDIILNQFEAPKNRNQVDARMQKFEDIYNSLPEVGGGTATVSASTDGSTGVSGNCACTPVNTSAKSGKTVAIDPGHGPNNTEVDSKTGLKMVESNNQPEGKDVWDVAQKVKTKLEADGYTVVMLKKSENENVTFRERATRADEANADIALSIHGDPGLPNKGQIYPQKVGLYRGSGSNKTAFNDAAVARESQQYSEVFKSERQKTEGSDIIIKDNSFDGRAGLEPGNIQMVQLFSKTPWVYNEAKMSFDKDKYAEGLVNGAEESLKDVAATGSDTKDCPGGGVGSGDIIGTAFGYAYEDGRKTLTMKDTYKAAVDAAKKNGEYIGGIAYPGIDCGGFVTRVMRNSGADKDYNDYEGPTSQQQKYMDDHPEKYEKIGAVSSVGKLKPGDIAVNSQHTFLYVGPEASHPNFKGNAAASSLDDYAPTANNTYFSNGAGSFMWYRLK
jgi:N-acetylmuramoyl-L-alanine amidase